MVALRMAGIAGQDKLNGIFEHLSSGHRWQLEICRTKQEFTAEAVRHELTRGIDGFIIGIPDTDDAISEVVSSGKPAVFMNVGAQATERSGRIAFVKSDSVAVGREAAQTLLRQGIFRSYGYAGYRTDADWSRERGTAFRDALEKAGFVGRMFDIEHYKDGVEDKRKLANWLRELPKPCGILAACDDRAFEVLDVCSEIGLKVPADVGVLGVNNDPVLCENAATRLSSVQPDFIREGRLGAELLERMMSGMRLPESKRVNLVGIRTIVHRDSTVPQSNSGKLVQKVLAFISREATRGLNVDDLAKRFKVSRSLLDLRFRELQGESVYETMLRIRLEEVKRRLRQTGDSISDITAACGWKNPIPLKAIFKRRFGMSMRDYRAKHR